MFDVAQSNANNDGGHAVVASFLPYEDADLTTWPGLIASPSTNAESITLDTGDLVAKSGKKWIQITTETEMIGATVGSEGSKGSISMVGQPNLKFNNCTAEELGFINSVKNKAGFWVIKDLAGTQWIYGTPDLPASASEASAEFGTAVGDDKTAMIAIRAVEVPKVYPGAISYAAVA